MGFIHHIAKKSFISNLTHYPSAKTERRGDVSDGGRAIGQRPSDGQSSVNRTNRQTSDGGQSRGQRPSDGQSSANRASGRTSDIRRIRPNDGRSSANRASGHSSDIRRSSANRANGHTSDIRRIRPNERANGRRRPNGRRLLLSHIFRIGCYRYVSFQGLPTHAG